MPTKASPRRWSASSSAKREVIMHIETLPDPQALAHHVAEWMTAAAQAATGPFRVSLSGGSTPKALYGLLASDPFRDRFPWQRVSWYWGDERFVPPDHPESNYRMTREAMLSKAPVPPENVHPVPIEGMPDDAASHYEQILHKAYGAACSIRPGRCSTSRCWGWGPTATPPRCCPASRCCRSASAGSPRSRTAGPRSASP